MQYTAFEILPHTPQYTYIPYCLYKRWSLHTHTHTQTEEDPSTHTRNLVNLRDRAVFAPAGVARHGRDEEASGSSRSM
jgi:hypothetical protein